jgi:S1-C subfamily serine protease
MLQPQEHQTPAAPEPAVAAPDPPLRRRPARLPSVVPAKRRLAVVLVLLAGAGAALAATRGSQGGSNQGRTRPWMGVVLGASPVLAGGFQSGFGGFPFGAGAIVINVVPGSPAANAGIEPGDVITEIGNQPVSRPGDVGSSLAGLHVGDRVQVQYEQGPLTYTTLVTLTAQPAAHR